MKIGVYYIASTTAAAAIARETDLPWIKKLSDMSGLQIEFTDKEHINDYDLILDFIGTGGSENYFLKDIDFLPKPVFLLTTGTNNSLAASMEIVCYLRQHDIPGEIIHGSDEYVVRRISQLAKVFAASKRLHNFKIARVGEPSEWLIASGVDADESKALNGIEIIDVTMEEFEAEIGKNSYEENDYTKSIKAKNFDSAEIEKALCIYGALKRICNKYQLDGVTVRCFDLLTSVKSTSCAALAILNAEGIYAACEGDVPALLSMAVIGELSGKPVFQANPSQIFTDTNEIIFAHCTLPLNMVKDFEIMTHFESQIGVAFRGKLAEGPITVFKTDGLIQEYFVSGGILEENLTKYNLCRTQVKLKLDNPVSYFLQESIGNHHIIVEGDYVDLVNEFYRWY